MDTSNYFYRFFQLSILVPPMYIFGYIWNYFYGFNLTKKKANDIAYIIFPLRNVFKWDLEMFSHIRRWKEWFVFNWNYFFVQLYFIKKDLDIFLKIYFFIKKKDFENFTNLSYVKLFFQLRIFFWILKMCIQ